MHFCKLGWPQSGAPCATLYPIHMRIIFQKKANTHPAHSPNLSQLKKIAIYLTSSIHTIKSKHKYGTYLKSEFRILRWPQPNSVSHPRESRIEKGDNGDKSDNVDDDIGHQRDGGGGTGGTGFDHVRVGTGKKQKK